MNLCAGCGKPLPVTAPRGRQRRTCSDACRQMAHKRRHAGEEPPVFTSRGEWTVDGIDAFLGQLMGERVVMASPA